MARVGEHPVDDAREDRRFPGRAALIRPQEPVPAALPVVAPRLLGIHDDHPLPVGELVEPRADREVDGALAASVQRDEDGHSTATEARVARTRSTRAGRRGRDTPGAATCRCRERARPLCWRRRVSRRARSVAGWTGRLATLAGGTGRRRTIVGGGGASVAGTPAAPPTGADDELGWACWKSRRPVVVISRQPRKPRGVAAPPAPTVHVSRSRRRCRAASTLRRAAPRSARPSGCGSAGAIPQAR